ncbi:hypothetical protein P5774_28010, partial [Bacillus tropicus]|nr:hypothetical protein [Bacillus tropicus]
NNCTLELLVNSFPFSKLIKPFWAAYAGFTKIIEKTIENTKITVSQAAETTAPIMKEYMSKHTYKHDLKMMLKVRGEELPKD